MTAIPTATITYRHCKLERNSMKKHSLLEIHSKTMKDRSTTDRCDKNGDENKDILSLFEELLQSVAEALGCAHKLTLVVLQIGLFLVDNVRVFGSNLIECIEQILD